MEKYIITIKSNYVRDAITPRGIYGLSREELDNEENYADLSAPAFLGIIDADTEEEAITKYIEEECQEGYDPRILEAIRVGSADSEKPPIYTHDTAALVVEIFEDLLTANNIHIPSPEDNKRDPDDQDGLYGSVYSDLLDSVENILIEQLKKHGVPIIEGEFSGNI